MAGKAKIPAQVLTRAKQVAIATRKPAVSIAPAEAAKPVKKATREKVIRALQKLHPMD